MCVFGVLYFPWILFGKEEEEINGVGLDVSCMYEGGFAGELYQNYTSIRKEGKMA